MSALGQKRTFTCLLPMSALPPKADIGTHSRNVRFSFGHDGKSIARTLDRTPQSVRVKAVEIGVRLRPSKMHHRRIKLSFRAWRALQTEADRLGTSAGRLARLVVETVARDRLFSAVIDAPAPQRKKRAVHWRTETNPPTRFATYKAARSRPTMMENKRADHYAALPLG